MNADDATASMWYVDKRKFIIFSSVLCIFCAILLSFCRNNQNICVSDDDAAAALGENSERINVEHRVSERRLSTKKRVNNQSKCWRKIDSDSYSCRPRCENGSFSLFGFDQCIPWLNCHHLKHVELVRQINQGAVKKVYLGLWQGNYVAVSFPTVDVEGNNAFEADFKHGLRMLIGLGSEDRVTQLIGFCWDPLVIITEYHEFGSVDRFREILENDALRKYDTPRLRFGLCFDYVRILVFLHSSPMGVRVMCDSNDLKKTLEQYLLTQDFSLVVNDLDALPEVNSGGNERLIKCGRKELFGSFVAPEQKWPYPQLPFNDSSMPGYDEKTDVWKIPDVCHAFLHRRQGDDDLIRFHLFSIHKMCKSIDPEDRPSATQVLQVYSEVWNRLFASDEE